jgi:hypothetical protein
MCHSGNMTPTSFSRNENSTTPFYFTFYLESSFKHTTYLHYQDNTGEQLEIAQRQAMLFIQSLL